MNAQLNQIDVIVRDVPAATEFFRDMLGLTVRFADPRFAELDAGGGFTLMLSPDALVPTKQAAGIILHFQVEDVVLALEEVRSRGATVLLETTRTGWGTESAMIAGPEDVTIDLYRPVTSEA